MRYEGCLIKEVSWFDESSWLCVSSVKIRNRIFDLLSRNVSTWMCLGCCFLAEAQLSRVTLPTSFTLNGWLQSFQVSYYSINPSAS